MITNNIENTNPNSPLRVGGFRGLGGLFLLKTAFRSLIGNGLKTWLNVIALSVSFVLIIAMQGILKGWSTQAVDDTIKW